MIKIKNLSHSYSGKQILKNVSLEIEKGSIHSLVGTTGAGKTLLLRILARLENKQEGVIENEHITSSFVFQRHALFPWLKLSKNIEITSGKSASEIRPLLQKFNLDEYIDQYPHQLSGGTLQKFNLLRAFIMNAEIIYLDEPFSHLDPIQRESSYDFMMRLWNESKPTIILVTHDIDEALLLSHKISFLSKKHMSIRHTFQVKETGSMLNETLLSQRSNPQCQKIYNETYLLIKEDLA